MLKLKANNVEEEKNFKVDKKVDFIRGHAKITSHKERQKMRLQAGVNFIKSGLTLASCHEFSILKNILCLNSYKLQLEHVRNLRTNPKKI